MQCRPNNVQTRNPVSTCVGWERRGGEVREGGARRKLEVKGRGEGKRYRRISAREREGGQKRIFDDEYSKCYIFSFLHRVVCTTTPPVATLVMDHLQMRLGSGSLVYTVYSNDTFSYLVPRLNSAPGPNPFNLLFSPPRGPISGGTNLSIWGDSLHIGSMHYVIVAGQQCQLTSIA